MDEVIIGIGINDNKKTWFPMDKRLEMIRGLLPMNLVSGWRRMTV